MHFESSEFGQTFSIKVEALRWNEQINGKLHFNAATYNAGFFLYIFQFLLNLKRTYSVSFEVNLASDERIKNFDTKVCSASAMAKKPSILVMKPNDRKGFSSRKRSSEPLFGFEITFGVETRHIQCANNIACQRNRQWCIFCC